MKRRYAILIGSMIFLLLSLCACGQAKNKDGESQKDKLGEEPTLILVDLLSSQANNIQLSASSYSWNVDKGLGQMESTIACGATSLEFAGMDMVTKIKCHSIMAWKESCIPYPVKQDQIF